jgi:hypothetical protein
MFCENNNIFLTYVNEQVSLNPILLGWEKRPVRDRTRYIFYIKGKNIIILLLEDEGFGPT